MIDTVESGKASVYCTRLLIDREDADIEFVKRLLNEYLIPMVEFAKEALEKYADELEGANIEANRWKYVHLFLPGPTKTFPLQHR